MNIKRLLALTFGFLLRSAAMFLLLCAADAASPVTGIRLGVSPAAVLAGGLFGVPGVGLVLAAKMICG